MRFPRFLLLCFGLDCALRHHRIGHLEEARDVRAYHIIARRAVLGCGSICGGKDAFHNADKLFVYLCERPG